MKTSKIGVGLVALMSLTATASFSAPSSVGPTGLLNVPTAESVTTERTEVMLASDRLHVGGTGINVFPIVTLEHGFANGEIGVSYFDVRGHTSVKSANAKYIFAQQRANSPALAAGVIYLRGNTSETDLYLVATHRFGISANLRLTSGLLYQKPNNTSTNHFTGMMGVEFGNPGKTTLGIDYIVNDVAAGGLLGATIRQRITPDLAGQIGIGNHSRFFAGLTLQFGGK